MKMDALRALTNMARSRREEELDLTGLIKSFEIEYGQSIHTLPPDLRQFLYDILDKYNYEPPLLPCGDAWCDEISDCGDCEWMSQPAAWVCTQCLNSRFVGIDGEEVDIVVGERYHSGTCPLCGYYCILLVPIWELI